MVLAIWTEKYRPKTLAEVRGQDDVVSRLKAFVISRNMPHLLFAGPAGVGKCVLPDTPVMLGDGKIVSIKEVYKCKAPSIMSLDSTGRFTSQEISSYYKGKADKLVKLELSSKKEVSVTPEHPFLVMRRGKVNWVQARDIKKDDLIATPLNIDFDAQTERSFDYNDIKNMYAVCEDKRICKISELHVKDIIEIFYKSKNNHKSTVIKPPELNKEFSEWLGMFLGDGSFDNSRIRFYNKRKELLDKFEELSYAVFGGKIRIRKSTRKNVPFVAITSAKTITCFLNRITGLKPGKKAHLIDIPAELLIGCKENLAAFIRGYFECDGYAGTRLEFSSSSKNMIISLNYALLRFGIASSISLGERRNRLFISGEFIDKFKRTISPKVKQIITKRRVTNVDVMQLSYEDTHLIMNSLGITLKDIVYNDEVLKYAFERHRASRRRIQQIYFTLSKVARERIEKAISCLGVLKNFDFNDSLIKLSIRQLEKYSSRKKIQDITGIRYDRLKDYYLGKRTPNLLNFLKILRATNNDAVYNQVLNMMVIKKNVLETLNILRISYNEISRETDINPANIAFYFNSNTLSSRALVEVADVFNAIRKIIERKIMNAELIDSLENIDFLSKAQIFWEGVKDTRVIDYMGEVYDLTINSTHNFVGGHGAIVLHNTASAVALAKDLFGDVWKDCVLELNASDERGIDIVRNKIKEFARSKALQDVPFKVIYLDEADALTKDAQHALRRTMEDYALSTRFILSCNYSSKIISPIQSRCAVFRFKPLPKDVLINIITNIAEKEGLMINAGALNFIYQASEGDCRKAENLLQACSAITKEITLEVVEQVVSFAEPQEISEIIILAITGKFAEAKNKLFDIMVQHGLSGMDVISQIQRQIWAMESIDEKAKVELIKACGEYEFRLVEGSNEFIQLDAMLAHFSQIGGKVRKILPDIPHILHRKKEEKEEE